MVYVEAKKLKGHIYYYHTRGFRIDGKVKKVRKYAGKDKSQAFSMSQFYKTIDAIYEDELTSVKKPVTNRHLTRSDSVLNDIFKDNIYVSNIREFNKEIDSKIEAAFPIAFIYNSNCIEGSKLPISEVQKIVEGKTTKYKNKNEVLEAQNSIKAYKYIKKEFNFTMKSILELHKILTKDLLDNGSPYHQGFKEVQIVVGPHNAETTKPDLVRKELSALLKWYNTEKKIQFVPELAFKFYYRFEKIHPFEDGNGRTGRLIMNKILMSGGYEPMIIYEKHKTKHTSAFRKMDRGKSLDFYHFLFSEYRVNFKEFYEKFLERE